MTDTATTFKNKGNEAFTAGRYQEAVDYFTKAIELNPNDHVFYSNRSGAFASLEKYEEALRDAEKCVGMKPDWAKGYQRKGLAEFYLSKLDDAEKTYKKGLEIDGKNQQLKEGLERVLEEKRNKPKGPGAGAGAGPGAEMFLQKLLTNPKTAAYFKDPDFIQKLTAIQQNPQMLGVYMNDPKIKDAFEVLLGGGGFNFDEEEKGEAHKHENCSHDHDHSHHDHSHHDHHDHSHHNKPQSAEPQSKPKESKQETTHQQKDINEAEQEKNKGNEEYKKKNFEKAIEHYDKAFSFDPTEYIYLNNKAAALLELKRYDECSKTLDQAIEISKTGTYNFSKIAKVYARKASLYTHLEDYENAIEWYKKSLLEDQNDKVKDELKRVEKLKKELDAKRYINPEIAEEHRLKGNELFQQGKFPESIKEYEEGIRRNPNDAKLYANRGTAYLKLMEYPSALKDVEKSISLDPNYVKAYAKKGVIHHAMKEYHKAIEAFEKGLKIDPENVECKDGLRKTKEVIMMSNYSESKEDQQERLRHAMADPEIQNILKDPQIHTLLQDLQKNPRDPTVLKALSDPTIAGKLEKLMAAGILRTG